MLKDALLTSFTPIGKTVDLMMADFSGKLQDAKRAVDGPRFDVERAQRLVIAAADSLESLATTLGRIELYTCQVTDPDVIEQLKEHDSCLRELARQVTFFKALTLRGDGRKRDRRREN